MPVLNRFRLCWLCGLLVLVGLLSAAPTAVRAQGQRRVVQFSGIIATGDSLLGVPGATIFVPKAGRGTATNAYGYFSLPVLTGDSIVIRSLGYANQTIIIPPDFTQKLKLKADETAKKALKNFGMQADRDRKSVV